jgi:hypothetical protein
LNNKFEVLPFTKANLCEALRSDGQYAEDIPHKIQFPQVFEYFTRKGDDGLQIAKTILVEKDYFSQSFFDDYKTKHIDSYSAKELNKHCKRVHFFSLEFNYTAAKSLFFSKNLNKKQTKLLSAYLGYIVIRPIQYTIGATILKWIPPTKDKYNLSCLVKNNVNLFGRKINPYSSLIFQEQDKLVGACATSALWTILEKCSRNFKTMNYSPSRLTELAGENTNKIPRRLFPNNGLDINQLCSVLKRIGLDWDILNPSNESEKLGIQIDGKANETKIPDNTTNDESLRTYTPSDYNYLTFRSKLYAYTKGGFPNLFGIRFSDNTYHAVASVGYKELSESEFTNFNNEVGGFNEKYSRPLIVNEMIDEFIFHDDQIGPFTSIKITASGLYSAWNKIEHGKIEPHSLLTPIHPTWIINHQHLEDIVRYLDFLMERDKEHQNSTKLLWDFHLTKSNTFKTGIAKSQPKFGQDCLLNSLPEYVWLIDAYQNINNINDGKKSLTIVCDPTSVDPICPTIEILVYQDTALDTLKKIRANNADIETLQSHRRSHETPYIKTNDTRRIINNLKFNIAFRAFLESKKI